MNASTFTSLHIKTFSTASVPIWLRIHDSRWTNTSYIQYANALHCTIAQLQILSLDRNNTHTLSNHVQDLTHASDKTQRASQWHYETTAQGIRLISRLLHKLCCLGIITEEFVNSSVQQATEAWQACTQEKHMPYFSDNSFKTFDILHSKANCYLSTRQFYRPCIASCVHPEDRIN